MSGQFQDCSLQVKMRGQTGFSILTFLLLVIAMLVSVASVFIGTSPNIPSQINAQKTTQLVAHAQLIAQRIVKCATDYSEFNSKPSSYPIDANPGTLPVANLVCPANSQNLWSGIDGVFLPAPPTGFNAWQYVNDSVSGNIYIKISSIPPANYATVISAAASKIGPAADTTTDTLTVFLKKPTP